MTDVSVSKKEIEAMPYDSKKLHTEFLACGAPVVGCDYDGTIHWDGTPDTTLETLVKAAHGLAFNSTEGLALKTYLGAASQEWQDYKKLPATAVREERFMIEAFPFLQQSLYDHFRDDAGQVDIKSSDWFDKMTDILEEEPIEEE